MSSKAQLRINHSIERAGSGQDGYVLIIVLALLVTGTLAFLVHGLEDSRTLLDRNAVTLRTLQDAKEALIYNAAFNEDRPGGLRCPDRNNDGEADFPGTNCANTPSNSNLRVGRLPWDTLDLPNDPRDGYGERLWYALSSRFINNSPSNNQPTINSNLVGDLRIVGSANEDEVVAVLIAPGYALGNQNRSSTADPNSVSNYLEQENDYVDNDAGGVNDGVFARRPASSSPAFNDVVLPIRQHELFAAVDGVVAARINQSIKPFLEAYFDFWGAYPYAAELDGRPSTGAAIAGGKVGTLAGLLPIDLAPTTSELKWDASSCSAPVIVSDNNLATATGTLAGTSLGEQCDLTIYPNGAGTVQVTLATAMLGGQGLIGRGFFGHYTDSVLRVTRDNEGTLLVKDFPSDVSVDETLPATHGSIQTNGQGIVTYGLTIASALTQFTVTIEHPVVSTFFSRPYADSTVKWFFENDWQKLTYYAVSPGAAPGAGGCSVKPCFEIKEKDNTNVSDVGAVLVFGGGPRNSTQASARIGAPPASLNADYLGAFVEEENIFIPTAPYANPANTFRNRIHDRTFNDYVIGLHAH